MAVGAVEIAAVDLDGDGEADDAVYQVAVGEDVAVLASVDAQLTEPQIVSRSAALMHLLAARDLNADGFLELFFGGYGNTARRSVMLSYDGCRVGPVLDDQGDVFMVLTGVGGNSCLPTGCLPRVRCVDTDGVGVLEASLLEPDPTLSFDERIDLIGADDVPVVLTTKRWRFDGEHMVLISETVENMATASLPPDAPHPSDSDVVDC